MLSLREVLRTKRQGQGQGWCLARESQARGVPLVRICHHGLTLRGTREGRTKQAAEKRRNTLILSAAKDPGSAPKGPTANSRRF